MLSFRPKLGPPGAFIFPLGCTLLSYAIPDYGKLCCILRATLHPMS